MIATTHDNGEEMFPVVDENGNIIDAATRAHCHDGSKLLHPVVHLHVFNSRGELFLQKRPDWKDIQPGRWDTAVGGHVDLGESVAQALVREVGEELGIELKGIRRDSDKDENTDESAILTQCDTQSEDMLAERLTPYVFESERERELVYPFRLTYDGPIVPSAETDGGRFWTAAELHEAMASGDQLTPNFVSEYRRLGLQTEMD